MVTITDLDARLIFNSRGSETIEIDVVTDKRHLGRAAAPSGASVGTLECRSFPMNSPEKAIEFFDENKSKFVGVTADDPEALHSIMKEVDPTPNYSKLGGSVAYALSIASADSAANTLHVPLFKLLNKNGPYRFPFPLGNVLGGGAHAGPGTPDIQEVLVVPIGATNIAEALKMNFQIHKEVRNIIQRYDTKFTYGRGDEGAWAPNVTNDEALQITEEAISNAGFNLGQHVAMGIDFASSSIWDAASRKYDYSRKGRALSSEEQIDYVNNLIKSYKLLYVEDPVNEEDFSGMSLITSANPGCIVTGDDLLVTNVSRLTIAAKHRACSGAILKVNQAGSLYDALQFANGCRNDRVAIITSHRSGESTDSHIAHIAIATGSKMIKTGILGGERIAKLNELLRIREYGLIEGMAEICSV
ncbi:MAG TPA: enolase [Nitrososphaeraceae archaeon]|jgi:enolase|nr:enolase [Nitrososphaeraceae archaeon]